MSQEKITVQVNADDKAAFEKICNVLGLSTSAAINLYIKTVLREKCIPFEIKADSVSDLATKPVWSKAAWKNYLFK